MPSVALKGYLLALLGVLILSPDALLIRLAGDNPMLISAWRGTFGGCFAPGSPPGFVVWGWQFYLGNLVKLAPDGVNGYGGFANVFCAVCLVITLYFCGRDQFDFIDGVCLWLDLGVDDVIRRAFPANLAGGHIGDFNPDGLQLAGAAGQSQTDNRASIVMTPSYDTCQGCVTEPWQGIKPASAPVYAGSPWRAWKIKPILFISNCAARIEVTPAGS